MTNTKTKRELLAEAVSESEKAFEIAQRALQRPCHTEMAVHAIALYLQQVEAERERKDT